MRPSVSDAATILDDGLEVFGPDAFNVEGRAGLRYWFRRPFAFTGNAEVDERLSAFPVAVFLPAERRAEETPVVVGLQGMAQPFTYNGFLVPTLLDMGIACVLLETPFAGERSLLRTCCGEIIQEIVPLVTRRVRIRRTLVLRILEAVAGDLLAVFRLLGTRHGLVDERRALFGVSFGALLSAFAFLRDGTGERLLGAIGHSDLPRFAHSYTPALARWLATLPARALAQLGAWVYGDGAAAGLRFLAVLNELARGFPMLAEANPMTYVAKAGRRRVRFLVGDADPVVQAVDAQRCAERFADGACYVVPNMAHGGDGFIGHARYYVETQLGDWRR